jgi:uncharacterized metal-binding protein YceD (DUF177 family)
MAFNIFIDRLKGGATEKIEETHDSAFLGPDETDLKFGEAVKVKGTAYLTDDHLVIQMRAATMIQMPCAVCNKLQGIKLVGEFTTAEPIAEIRGAVFDYSEALREALLLELPKTIECNGGKCPERAAIKPYLQEETRTYFPFADLEKLGE